MIATHKGVGGFPVLSEDTLLPFCRKNMYQEDDLSGSYFVQRQENTQKEENIQANC